MIQGRSPDQVKALLDATHRAVLAAFKVPLRDRYQIVHEHPPSHFIAEDTGLGIPRTRNVVIIQVTTRPHERAMKENFYQTLVHELQTACGLAVRWPQRSRRLADWACLAAGTSIGLGLRWNRPR